MFKIEYFDIVSSTMDVIKDKPVYTVVIANKQTNGRGKMSRIWESQDSNNLYFSIKIQENSDSCFNYVFIISLLLLEILKYFFKDINLNLKWPNDLLLNNKKIAGILLERDIQNGTLIIGIGVNIDSYPEETIFNATSLKNQGYILDKKYFLEKFLDSFGKYNLNSFEIVRKEWLKHAYNFKQEISVRVNNLEFKGIFEDIDFEGNLILNCENKIIKISSGDIF